MKQILCFLLMISYVLILFACKKEQEPIAPPYEEPQLGKVDIADAQDIYLLKPSAAKASKQKNILYKINSHGETKEVAFLDINDKEIKVDVVFVLDISNKYIVVSVITPRENISPNGDYLPAPSQKLFLVRNIDGAVFSLEKYGNAILHNVSRKLCLLDSQDNLHWIYYNVSEGGSGYLSDTKVGSLYKMNIPKIGDIVATAVSGDLRPILSFGIDNNDNILMEIGEYTTNRPADVVFKFVDGTFVKCDVSIKNSPPKYFAIKGNGTGGFIVLEQSSESFYKTKITKIVPDGINKKLEYIDLGVVDKILMGYSKRDDLADGSSMIYSSDYKDYIFVSADGTVEAKSYEVGFSYEKRVVSNDCVYGVDGSSIYSMSFKDRQVKTAFSDNRYRINSYQVAPDNSYINIDGLRYSDATKVLLRVDSSGQIIRETPQTDNSAEIITFIRLK